MDKSPLDAYTPYEEGVLRLLDKLGNDHPHLNEVLAYQQQLVNNLSLLRQFGDTETRRTERTHIIDQLNEISLTLLGIPFKRLCTSTAILSRLPSPSAEEHHTTHHYPTFKRNPFGDIGRITDPDLFFDRVDTLHRVFDALYKGNNLSLVGEPGIGKSSLLSMVSTLGPQRLNVPPDTFAYLNVQNIQSEEHFFDVLCKELHVETSRGERLRRALHNKIRILCIDEIEKMTWDSFPTHIFQEVYQLASSHISPLQIIFASCKPLIPSLHQVSDVATPRLCIQIELERFSPEISRSLIQRRLDGLGITFSEEEIATILEISNGHPAQLQRAAADLYRTFSLMTERKP